MSNPPEFYYDFGRPDVQVLARAICGEMRSDPDGLVPETGYINAALIPRWWLYQEDALKFIAMEKASEGIL